MAVHMIDQNEYCANGVRYSKLTLVHAQGSGVVRIVMVAIASGSQVFTRVVIGMLNDSVFGISGTGIIITFGVVAGVTDIGTGCSCCCSCSMGMAMGCSSASSCSILGETSCGGSCGGCGGGGDWGCLGCGGGTDKSQLIGTGVAGVTGVTGVLGVSGPGVLVFAAAAAAALPRAASGSLPLARLIAWRFTCLLRWSLRMKRLSHTGQANLFSPVCVRKWRANSSERANLLPQPSQLQG